MSEKKISASSDDNAACECVSGADKNIHDGTSNFVINRSLSGQASGSAMYTYFFLWLDCIGCPLCLI